MRLSGICKCGCGKRTKRSVKNKGYNLYVLGHQFKGKSHSEEAKKKLSEARTGKKLSEEHKKKISIGGVGKKRTEETKRKISEALKRHEYDPERIKKLKENSFDATGRKWSEEIKQKISKSNKGKHNHFDKSNPNWKGGISFLPYPPEWKTSLKKRIKARDGETCQNPNCCKKSPTLTVHHIDYVKENCSEENLITLCYVCNSKANSRRDYWKDFYSKIIREKYAAPIKIYSPSCSF